MTTLPYLALAALWMLSVPAHSQESATGAYLDSLDLSIVVSGNEASFRVYKKVTVSKPAGSAHARIGLSSSPLQSIASFSAKMFDASGKQVKKWSLSELERACGFGAGFEVYSDECKYYLLPEHPKFPYTVEQTYESKLKSLFLLPSADLAYAIPVARAVVTITHPTDRPIRYKQYRFDTEPTVVEKGDKRTVQWQCAEIPAFKESAYSPPEFMAGPHIAFAAERFSLNEYSFRELSWKNVGLWYRQLASDPDHGANFTVTPTADPLHLKERADSIYRETTRKTRYVAAYLDIDGWQPHSLRHIRQRQYGDCKDLTSLLTAELHAGSITAYPCLLLTSDEGATDTAFANFGFNHVITMALIGDDTLWYDPTCDICPPGQLPSANQGAVAVVATDTGGVLVTVPFSSAESNRIVRSIYITADSVGRIALKVRAAASGSFALRLRAGVRHMDRKEIDQYITNWLIGSRPQYKVLSYQISGEDDLAAPVQIEYELSCAKQLDIVGSTRYLLPFLFTSRNLLSDARLDDREIPLWLGYPWQTIDTVTISGSILARATQVITPPDTAWSYPWGDMIARFTASDSIVTALLIQTYPQPVIPVSDFEDFKSYAGKRRWIVDQAVKFEMTPP